MENLPLDGGLLGHVLLGLLCLNILLGAIDKILVLIKDRTRNDLDNKLYALVHKGAEYLGKLLDLLSNKK